MGRGKERLVTHVNIPQRLCQDSGKTTSELSCGTAHHNDLACSTCEKDGRRHAMGMAAKYMGYKSLREEHNLAVKGILREDIHRPRRHPRRHPRIISRGCYEK